MARIAPLNIDWKPDRTTGEPVTEQIVGYMCEQVHSGNWPIGSRLPSQRALAEWFGVNRSTVIAAINELSDYGIVEGQHGAGTRIVSNTWSLMLPGAPDWADYVDSGFFKANNDTIQAINRYEFTPNMTRIGTGELDPRLFPKAMWRQVLGEAADEIETLGYPPPEGLPELREAIAAHMRATGVDCTASQVLVTSGALQALQMISVSLLPAGTTVYAESPSYIKSLQVFQSAGMHLEGVPMDDDGLNVQALRGLLAEGELDAGRPAPLNARNRKGNAILYTIPTNHNPTGVTMSDKRRHELVELSVDSRLPIIEDGAYRDLYFEDDAPLPSLKALDETGMVITLGSASKSLAPGLRIGWLVAAEPIVQRRRENADGLRCERAEPVDVRAIPHERHVRRIRGRPETGAAAPPRPRARYAAGENGRARPLERAVRRLLHLDDLRPADTHEPPVPAGRRTWRAAQPRRHLRFRRRQLPAPELLLHHAGRVRRRSGRTRRRRTRAGVAPGVARACVTAGRALPVP